jgi:hypothetical protein
MERVSTANGSLTRAALFPALLLAAALTVHCGGESSAPTTVVTPAPTPTPTPAPTPSPSASATGCRLPPQPECAERGGGGCCRRESNDQYGEAVEMAIRDVQASHPDFFDGDLIREEQNEDTVVALVAQRLEQRYGLCASPGNPIEDEIAVKGTNDFSEQFDIIFENDRVNVFGYTVTCRPARF